MALAEHLLPAERPEWDVLYGLLQAAAGIIEDDDQPLTEHLLRETAICECQAWELPETRATGWLIREACYQIACTVAIRPRHRDDPLIAAVIEILSSHPPHVQARILRATAQHLPQPCPALPCPRHERHPAMTVQDITDPATGKSRLLSDRCATCIFRPANAMDLAPGRLAQMVGEALARDRYIICHDTLTYGPYPEFGPAICRGFHDAYGRRSLAIRLMYAFNNITEVRPPGEPDTSARPDTNSTNHGVQH